MKNIFLIAILFVLGLSASSNVFALSDIADSISDYHFKNIEYGFNHIANNFKDRVYPYAKNLFWILATISLTWTAIEMAFKRAEFGEIVAELCKFIIFTGLFFFLLDQGPELATSISDSIIQIADVGSGISGSNKPLSMKLIDTGLTIGSFILANVGQLNIQDIPACLCLIISAFLVIFILTFIAIKLFILQVKILCQIYAGCFFLGFGGGKWFRDISINYYKSIIATSAQYMAMLFICSVIAYYSFDTELTQYLYDACEARKYGKIFEACSLFAVFPITGLFLTVSLPGSIANLISSNFHNSNQSAAETLANSASKTKQALTSPTARTIARNIPGSQLASRAVGGVWNTVRHPVKTAGAASNWMAGAVGQYKGSKQARKEANANFSQSGNNKSSSNNTVKGSSDIKKSQSNTQAKNSSDNSVKDATKQTSAPAQNQNTSRPEISASNTGKSYEFHSGINHSHSLSKTSNDAESAISSSNNEPIHTSNDLTPESAVTPDAVLKEAKELFNSGHCSQKAEENALDTAQNLANDPNVPDSVRQQANDLGNEILRNKEVNSFNRASSGGDTSNRTNDEATANQQKYQAQSKNWSSDSNTPMGMLNQAKGLYKSGTASKADEQKALMTALNLASDKNMPQLVRDEAQKLSTTIQQESDANATRRSSHGIGNTAMTQQDIEQYSQSINSAKSGFYKSGTSVQNNSSGSNGSLSPLNELKSSQVSQSPENRKTDIDNSSQNKSAVNQSQNKLNQSQSANSKQNNKPDNTKSDNRHINQIEIGDTAQNQERAALAKKNSETLGALWDATGGRGLRFINDHQPFHMITSYRAGHEMARERTEQKLASNKRE